ncbi:invasion associated locus B family protein [Telmatospirillum siberiense]|uniref:Invasion-associated locus B family protein n=1 Tax=Telmatospirillum siberiense TaxID=382514 RepID=A0A2N3PXR1_9PROT|nr:invasion associated locus B family protein [Telmatospirillum siberiense]PKU25165.1 invasion-associated locus B family protein [Telmatospirillum siberiense]
MKSSFTIAVLAGLFCAASSAGAADAPAPLWNKTCNKDANGKQSCVIEQFAVAMPQNSVLAHIRFFPTDKSDQTGMSLTAPLGVMLPQGFSLSVDDSKPILLPFERCGAEGCEAMAVLDKTAMAKFSTGKKLVLHYNVSEKKGMDIPIKLEGLSAALQSLSKSN